MGIKTIFGPKGPVVSRNSGTEDTIEFNGVSVSTPQKFSITVVAESGSASITAPMTLFRPGPAGVTGTLPTIVDSTIGKQYVVLKNSGTSPLLLTASAPIIGTAAGVGAWTMAVSGSGGRYTGLAVSGSTGFHWVFTGP